MKWIGADWDSAKCVVAFEDGDRVRQTKVARDPKSVAEFLANFEGESVTVGIEDGDGLWQRLWKNAGARVFVFDGKKARRFSESLHSSGARDDRRAARDLLEMVKSKRHREHGNVPRQRHSLSFLQMNVEVATKKVVEHEARLTALLRQYHPALANALVSRLRSEYALRIVELCPTVPSFRKLTSTGAMEFERLTLASQRRHLRDAVQEDWGAILIQEEPAIALLIRAEASSMRHALLRKKLADEALADATAQSPLMSLVGNMKGVGPYTLAALTLASQEAGTTHRDGIAVLLGAAPVTRRSGESGDAGPTIALRRSGSNVLRKSAHILGMQLVRHFRFARAQYDHLRARGKHHADAVRRVVRSFSRILYAILRDNTPFDEDRYIAALKSQGVAWARPL